MNKLWIWMVLSDIYWVIKREIKFILVCVILGAAILWPLPFIIYAPMVGIPAFIIFMVLALISKERW